MKKICFKCERELPLSEFYKHSGMSDGHLNKCKECARSDVKTNREANIDYYREYDRERGNRQSKDYLREYRQRFPNKEKAHCKIAYEIKRGNLVQQPCESCGEEKTHAHHDDYAKPLNIRWLCAACHRQWHIKNGEALNP